MKRKNSIDLEMDGKLSKADLKKKESSNNEDEKSDYDITDDESDELEASEGGLMPNEDVDDGKPDSKKRKLQYKKDLYKPPTSQEINALRETENLYHSSSFRLRVEEMLKTVKLKKNEDLHNFLDTLTAFLLKLEADSDTINLSNDEHFVTSGYKLPFEKLQRDDKVDFRFLPPSNVEILGSYSLGVVHRRHVVVDIGVEMPKTFIHKGDNLNYRYHWKRAMYLLRLTSELRNFEEIDEMQFTHFLGDSKKPCLLVKPLEGRLKKYWVRIIPYCPLNSFKLSKFIPVRNNVRPSWLFKGQQKVDEEIPTPFYNSSILQDMLIMENNAFLKSICGSLESVRDAVILLKTWAHQREFDRGFGGFNTFLISMFVAYLLKNKKINSLMSSYQIVRTTWLHLAKSQWNSEGITVCDARQVYMPSLADFHAAFEVVFVDATGYLNLCSHVSKTTYLRVRRESELAIQCLDHSESSAFDALFMLPAPFVRKFDHLIVLDNNALRKVCGQLGLESIDYGGHQNQLVVSKVIDYLNKGLNERIQFIDYRLTEPLTWDLTDSVETLKYPLTVVGLLLDSRNSERLVDKGPTADNAEALHFREFWGEKSELRHFQDGSTCETVVWPGKSISDKRAVCKHIVAHIFKRHLGLGQVDFKYLGTEFENVINKVSNEFDTEDILSAEEQTVTIIKSLESLSKDLKKLDLDLLINSVQGISPVFRYAEVFPPLAYSYKVNPTQSNFVKSCIHLKTNQKYASAWLRPLEVVLHVEASNKWPEDLEAIRYLKSAFYITLRDKLKKIYNLECLVHWNYIDVVKDGFVFRIIVATSREVVALKSSTSSTGLLKFQETEESVALEMRIDHLPKITSALHGLQMQHSTYSVICRLAKRWIYAQLLFDHINDVTIELLVASLFTQSQPFEPPNCPTVGFLRFLHLLSTFDWKISPLIVNLNNDMTKEEISEIETKFYSSRSDFPTLCIITPFDKQQSMWTKHKPLPMIVYRLHCLAKASLQVLENHYINPDPVFDSKMVFRYNTSLDDYDVIIHLNPAYVPSQIYAIDRPDSLRRSSVLVPDRGCAPVIDYNPAICYLNELKAMFSDAALFFYDYFGGLVITVLWKPTAFQYQPFKVSNISGKMIAGDISKKPVMVTFNEEIVIEEIANIGGDLVKYIAKSSRKLKS